MRLYSWNVNGFRSLSAKPDWQWFSRAEADLVGLQETKAEESQVDPSLRRPAGYNAYWLSAVRKGYSGVAVFSRSAPLAVGRELPAAAWQGEGRLLHLEFQPFHYLNVYFPNGQSGEERLNYKLGYYDAFLDFAQSLRREKPLVVCGDFNTAHRPIDLARPEENRNTSGFLPVERAWMDKFVAAGYVDAFRLIQGEKKDAYSWWSYRMKARERNIGWRIDYFFVSDELAPRVKDAWIEADVGGSDHCPVGLELDV
ncbi:MAG: exodeoxyribonuclease III [Deltaproteobacteria bacterium]|jgi:exodeoxyribonuclease-3|nr:exodeoxyribonuclease III [Deltaproteobacteria bacterium]